MEIKLYTTDGCPNCKMLKTKLERAGISYQNISGDDVIDAGIKTVPIFEVDGNRMKLSDANTWIKEYMNEHRD